jgi:hypothetical protein
LTSPIHDSHGAQIYSECEEKIGSLVPRILITHSAVLHFILHKFTPLSETETAGTIVYWEMGDKF